MGPHMCCTCAAHACRAFATRGCVRIQARDALLLTTYYRYGAPYFSPYHLPRLLLQVCDAAAEPAQRCSAARLQASLLRLGLLRVC